jgi:hypothetical protein
MNSDLSHAKLIFTSLGIELVMAYFIGLEGEYRYSLNEFLDSYKFEMGLGKIYTVSIVVSEWETDLHYYKSFKKFVIENDKVKLYNSNGKMQEKAFLYIRNPTLSDGNAFIVEKAFVNEKAPSDGTTDYNAFRIEILKKYVEEHKIDIPNKGKGSGKNGALIKVDYVNAIQSFNNKEIPKSDCDRKESTNNRKVFTLIIYSRDMGDRVPSKVLLSFTKEGLKAEILKYLSSHEDYNTYGYGTNEDFDKGLIEYATHAVEKEVTSPELETMYLTRLMESNILDQ